ncbi:hypothetical protein, partial [Bacillus thuringiensis]|uniref:hypothetical protein n=1 Tax=Bacillus thuringiensis TaxID=1428 RepID=UPI000C027539
QSSYEPFNNYIPHTLVEPKIITGNDIKENTIPLDKTTFGALGTNLYNKDAVVQNAYVNISTGALVNNQSGFVASEYIPVKSSVSYIIAKSRHVAFYDKNKAFISGQNTTGGSSATVTTPSSAAYMRTSYYPPADGLSIELMQINEGTSLLPFEKYGFKISKEYLQLPNTDTEPDRKAILSPEIYGVVGKEINIYFQNTLTVPQRDVQIDVTCSIGRQEERRWTCIPTAVGTYPLTVSVYRNFNLVKQTTTNIIIKAEAVGSGNKNVLIIGDSTVNDGRMTQRVLDLTNNDNLKVNLLGTRGTGANKHEGRGGWTAALYRTSTKYPDATGITNPFFNSAVNDFDFGYYMTNQGYSSLDYVGICLGINDTFSFLTDADLISAISTILKNLDFMINSIKAYNSTIKIGIFVTIPPNESQDAFGLAYGNGQTQWRYKRNNSIWIDELIKYYK